MMILTGEADVMIAGGGEAATRLNTVAGFGNARALARAFQGDPKRASRPYDVDRNGFVMGEGAGALVLEVRRPRRERGAKPLALSRRLGHDQRRRAPDAPASRRARAPAGHRGRPARAAVTPADVGYINPHATSTPQGDVAEYLS